MSDYRISSEEDLKAASGLIWAATVGTACLVGAAIIIAVWLTFR